MTRGLAWVKDHKLMTAILLVLVLGAIGAATGSGGDNKAAPKPLSGRDEVLKEVNDAPDVQPATAQDKAQAEAEARAAKAERRAEQRAIRQANRPRLVEYYIKGSTVNATVTYTSTGGGTVQRDVGALPEWRSAKVRLRPGDFAQMSVQITGGSGTISCKIVEHLPYRLKLISPPTTSSGAYVITDCNGTVR